MRPFILFAIYCIITTTNALVRYPDCFYETKHHPFVYYDLSVLSQQQWQVKIKETNKSAYLSLCGKSSVLNNKLCPDKNSSVCVVQQDGLNFREFIPNLGSHIKKWERKDNSLVVSLDGGQQCNESMNYSSVLHFTCDNETDIQLSANLLDCVLTVNWPTIAGCPINDVLLKKCVGGSGSTSFNLRPLYRRDSYIINNMGSMFELNICGALPVGHCGSSQAKPVTACELYPDRSVPGKVIGTSARAGLKVSEDGLLLLYRGGNVSTKIEFICNESVAVGEPRLTFISNSSITVYTFEFESSYACPLQNVDCTVSTEDEEFDLSALKNDSGNWLVETNNSRFYINICRSLNPVPEAICSDGTVGVCEVHTNGESFNLGMVLGGPKFKDDILSIKYTGGSRCTDMKRYSSVIRFLCSKSSRGPYLISNSSCQYTFEWFTPNACPKLVKEGANCKLYEPRTGIPFNMQQLHHSGFDYSLTSENVTFYINLCGSLVIPCNKKTDVSVCMKFQNDSREIAIGYTRNVLKYFNGRLTFDLKGDECLPGKKSTVTILLACHHQAFVNNSQPELLSFTHSECKFVFMWHTKLACKTSKEFDCKIQLGNVSYDLSSLSNPSHNHVTNSKSQNKSFTYFINVCRPVVSGFDVICNQNSGVCQLNNFEPDVTKRFLDLGDVEKGSLKDENGSLIIEYSYGDLCVLRGHYSTKIYLHCDKNANETFPKFIKGNNCEFEFSWRTRAACPVSFPHDDSPTIQENGNCSALNPSTGQMFDLIESIGKSNAVIENDGKKIMLGICESVHSVKCSAESGACMLGNVSTNYGNGNAHLQYDSGIYFLNYANGDECRNGIRRSTVIKFICVSNDVSLEPRIEIDNCSLTVYWFYSSVCQEKINCVIYKNDKAIDLSSLANNDSNYMIKDNDGTEYFINVCHPITSTTENKCIPGSSLCAVFRQKDHTIKVQNLGFLLSPPELDSNRDIVLKYSKGSQCTTDGFETSSSIHFKCKPSAGKGVPNFYEIIDKCEYNFIWETSVICDEMYSSPCLIRIPELNTSVDISILNTGIDEVKYMTTHFKISICNESNMVCKSEICNLQGQQSLTCGERKLVKFDHNSSTIKLIYQDETSETSTVEIWLVCNLTAGDGTPRQMNDSFLKESHNYPIFEWQTNVVCQVVPSNHSNVSPDSSGINKTGITIATVVSILVLFLIVIIIMILKREQLINLFRRSDYVYSRGIDDNIEL